VEETVTLLVVVTPWVAAAEVLAQLVQTLHQLLEVLAVQEYYSRLFQYQLSQVLVDTMLVEVQVRQRQKEELLVLEVLVVAVLEVFGTQAA
jgi:hypothetical protein